MSVKDFIELNDNCEMEFNICSNYIEEIDEYADVLENITLSTLDVDIQNAKVIGWFLEENQSISIEI